MSAHRARISRTSGPRAAVPGRKTPFFSGGQAHAVLPAGPAIRTEVRRLASKHDLAVIDTGGRDTTRQRAALTVADLLLFLSICRFEARWFSWSGLTSDFLETGTVREAPSLFFSKQDLFQQPA